MPRGWSVVALRGVRPALIFSGDGSERTAKGTLDDTALIHALIPQPSGSAIGSNSSVCLT
jgi:hypothetical protein